LSPSRGDVWLIDFDPTRGHEQAGLRPGLVISSTVFNEGPADLVIALPMTSRRRSIPTHVQIAPPEGGLREVSYVLTEHIRSVARERFRERWGTVSPATLGRVEGWLRVLLEL
jgi:mRNA interferase MazF